MTVTLTPLDKMKYYLRDEWRMKDGTDYAIAFKSGKANIICQSADLPYIAKAALKFKVEVGTLSSYDGRGSGFESP